MASQRAMPGWARGRLSAIVMMVSQGAIALGGVVWGFSSQAAGANITLIIAAVSLALGLLLAGPLLLRQYVDAGWLGKKTKRGIYRYD